MQASCTQDSITDPADLDLDEGYGEPELCFSRSQVRNPAYALLDSGATHVPGHTLPRGARSSFEVTVNLAVGNPVSPNPLNLRGADSPPKFKVRPFKNTLHQGVLNPPPLNLGANLRPLNLGGLG